MYLLRIISWLTEIIHKPHGQLRGGFCQMTILLHTYTLFSKSVYQGRGPISYKYVHVVYGWPQKKHTGQ